jgi:hypothetical protein
MNVIKHITCRSGAAHITGTSMCERTVSSCAGSIKLAVWMDVEAFVTKFAIRERPKHKYADQKESILHRLHQQDRNKSLSKHTHSRIGNVWGGGGRGITSTTGSTFLARIQFQTPDDCR